MTDPTAPPVCDHEFIDSWCSKCGWQPSMSPPVLSPMPTDTIRVLHHMLDDAKAHRKEALRQLLDHRLDLLWRIDDLERELDAQRATVARLTQENETLRGMIHQWSLAEERHWPKEDVQQLVIYAMRQRAESAEQETARLKAALENYGNHEATCTSRNADNEPCSCGLSAALTSPDAETP